MVWKTSYNQALGQPAFDLNSVDTVARVAIGTVVKGYDDVFGEGEFIYLPGVASCAAGDAVVYDLLPSGPAVVRALSGTHANSGRPVAFALQPAVAGQYGWFQINGLAIVSANAGAAAGVLMLSATAGGVSNAVLAGAQVLGARLSSAVGTPVAAKAYATIARPCVQSQIT